MTMADITENLAEKIESSSSSSQKQSIEKINNETNYANKSPSATSSANIEIFKQMKIDEVFALAKDFVKAKEGTKAIQLSYDDRNMINVLTKQINYKKFDEEKSKVGFLDLVGKDRLQLWKSLGDISKEESMKRYIELISRVCPLFYAHLEAHQRHLEELEQKRIKLIEEEEAKRKEMTEQKEKKLKEEDLKLLEENKKKREEIQRKQIQEALNQQTYPHFKAYAEQQHPNNPQTQEELIKQLQEQHFEQYMNQVYQQQLLHQQQQAEQLRAMRLNNHSIINDTSLNESLRAQKKQEQQTENNFKQLSLNSGEDNSKLSSQITLSSNTSIESKINNTSADQQTTISHDSINLKMISENESSKFNAGSLLKSKKQATDSKSSFTNINESQDSFDLSNNGETNLSNLENGEENDEEEVELPPISAASMLTRKDIKEFKESVRRDNDAIIKVGSGETVTVRVPTHEDGRLIFWEFATDYYDLGFGLYFEWTISPSNNVTVHVSDSSDEDDGDEEEDPNKQDLEKGDKDTENKPPCDEIIPIFRRDCHEEVYAGSHLYPGRGVYLLKFDNSYSLWRSKTLYYRVYYSK